jgi:MFS transporter, MHS family, alpha-ketoglutarate permease
MLAQRPEKAMSTTLDAQPGRAATLFGGAFGNFIEWYDWTIYGLLSGVFAAQIFPKGDANSALIAVLITFAVGFLMRPVGSIVLSPLADRYGRRRMLALTIILMGVGSLIVAVTPPYASIGIFAPVLLLVARLIQGFSTGGEFQGSSVYLVEHAPAHRRAFAGSGQMVSIGLALLVATATSALTTSLIAQPALGLWGWRIPFFVGAALALYGVWLRARLPETPSFENLERRRDIDRNPLLDAFRRYPRECLYVFTLQIGTVQFYTWTVFLPSYAHLAGGLPVSQGFIASTIATAIYCVAVPAFAALSDRIGRKPLLYGALGGFLILAWPMLSALRYAGFELFLLIDIIGILFISMSNAILPPLLCELFPTQVRTSGIGVPYAICSAIFGGTAPLIAAWFLQHGFDNGMALYIMAICLVSLTVFWSMPETAGKPLD